MSLGTGRPIVLRDECSVRHCRLLLTHPMASPTDVRLIAQIELITHKRKPPHALIAKVSKSKSFLYHHSDQLYDALVTSSNGQMNHNTLAIIRHANNVLDNWWSECDKLLNLFSFAPPPSIAVSEDDRAKGKMTTDEDSLPRKILASELYSTKLWLVCVALRRVSWDKMTPEQRELAFQAKDLAFHCLSVFLTSSTYR